MNKRETALMLKQQLLKSINGKTLTKNSKLKVSRNVGFGYYFPEHIKFSGEHHDYYSEEFAKCVTYLINNLEELVEDK